MDDGTVISSDEWTFIDTVGCVGLSWVGWLGWVGNL